MAYFFGPPYVRDWRLLPSHKCSPNFGNRGFNAAGPRVWIYPPTDLRQPALSYSDFRQSLKTVLCGQGDQIALWTLPPHTHFKLRFRNPLTYLITILAPVKLRRTISENEIGPVEKTESIVDHVFSTDVVITHSGCCRWRSRRWFVNVNSDTADRRTQARGELRRKPETRRLVPDHVARRWRHFRRRRPGRLRRRWSADEYGQSDDETYDEGKDGDEEDYGDGHRLGNLTTRNHLFRTSTISRLRRGPCVRRNGHCKTTRQSQYRPIRWLVGWLNLVGIRRPNQHSEAIIYYLFFIKHCTQTAPKN